MNHKLLYLVLTMFFFSTLIANSQTVKVPVKVAVIGLTHTHVHWLLGRENRGDIEIVAIVEPNRALAEKYSKQHGFSMNIVFNTMEEMLTKVKPQAVTAFGTIYNHLAVVEFCAPRGIDVMVEKPMAVSLEHARKMQELAQKYHIHLLTNYETSWYSSNQKAWEYVIDQSKVGDLRKIVFHTGHQGPIEIGCNPEFTDWLTDPILNGGGALMDFGCYGADITTWLMKGNRPVSVFCTTKQVKPATYPKVDDDCTILLSYPTVQVIIQASWNWPFNIKDMEIYGQSGYLTCKDRNHINYRWAKMDEAVKEVLPDNLLPPYNDPFSYLAAVERNEITPAPFELSSLETNMVVMEILEAAKLSAKTGKLVNLK
jgi:predicted dehydrogenase